MVKKILSFILVSVLVVSLLPNLEVSAQQDEGLLAISSVENYIAYLEEMSQQDDTAKELLAQFLNLGEEKQELFIRALQPENFIKIVNQSQKSLNEEVLVQLDNGQYVDVEAVFSSSEEDSAPLLETGLARNSLYKVTTNWANHELAVLGVTLAKYSVRLIYQTNLSVATGVYDVEKNYYNYNPTAWTTDIGYTGQYVSGGWAYGGYSWQIYATIALGQLSANLDMYVRATYPNEQYKVESSRDGWSSGGWLSY